MPLSIKHTLFNSTAHGLNGFLRLLPPMLRLKAAIELISQLDLVHTVKVRKTNVRIHCGSETIRQRAEKMPTREPDTLDWVETFKPDSVLYDVGSNIGVYSLYAALAARARVVAFDPLPFNFAGLCHNMVLNDVSDRIMPFCAAVSDRSGISTLHIPNFIYTPGGSGSTFDKPPEAYGLPYSFDIAQTVMGWSIDDFVERFDVPFPNHLKMDIDGVQDKVIRGARKTLRDSRVYSAMLELPPVTAIIQSVNDDMRAAGFRLHKIRPSAPGGTTEPLEGTTNHFYVKG